MTEDAENEKEKITKKTMISTLVRENPEAAEKLLETGMHCVGCPMAMQETIEQGCLAHGMSEKEIEELVEEMNKIVSGNSDKE